VTSTRISITTVILIAIATALLGSVATWVLSQSTFVSQTLSISLAHELETTGLCANALKLEPLPRDGRLTRLLEDRLNNAVQQVSFLADEGAVLGGAVSNLRESLRRAVDYYEGRGDEARANQAKTLLIRLDRELS